MSLLHIFIGALVGIAIGAFSYWVMRANQPDKARDGE